MSDLFWLSDCHAERQLRRGEAEEEDAAEQAEIFRAQGQVAGEVRRDHPDRIAQELADHIDHAQADHQKDHGGGADAGG